MWRLLRQCKYTRARDEVMWIVFQVVSSLPNAIRLDDAIQEIVDLYNILFDGDVVWMGASDHPALFARFLAAAGTWMLLTKDVSGDQGCAKNYFGFSVVSEKLETIRSENFSTKYFFC